LNAVLRADEPRPNHVLPALPYERDALQPVISRQTVCYHYNQHHRQCVAQLNVLVAGTPYAQLSLEALLRRTRGGADWAVIREAAVQVWNHCFYWRSLTPNGGDHVPFTLASKIKTSFGSLRALKGALAEAAAAQPESGWVWLVLEGSALRVASTHRNDSLPQHLKPLLTIDTWAHAYGLDYQHRRAEYARALLDRLINWEFAAANLS